MLLVQVLLLLVVQVLLENQQAALVLLFEIQLVVLVLEDLEEAHLLLPEH